MAPKRSTRSRRRAIKEKCFMNSLPRELIEQVFLRLPASCLLRCIGVCKMWRIIIRDSQFAMAHLKHVPLCTLVFSPKRLTSGTLCPSDAVIFDEAWSPSTWAAPVIGPDDLLCGTCNGLLCLHTPTSTLKIANLATGECLHLKKPTKSLKDGHFSFYRFGFHPVTKEYKVIHFSQEIGGSFTEGIFNVIQVYTLGDEKWKDFVTPEALSLNCVKNSGVVIVDGAMYWLIEDGGSNWKHAVMSFDLGGGGFAQIQLPAVELKDWAYSDVRNYWVTEINGKVCVSTANSFDRWLIYELQVWALNGTDQRWSHMYSIQLLSNFALGLHFVYGDKILIQHNDSHLYSYELIGKNFEIESSKMVKLLDLRPRGEDDLQFYTCVKSLVRLDLYAKAAVVCSPKRQGGWKLEKWKSWQWDFDLEKMWRKVYQLEKAAVELTQRMRKKYNEIVVSLRNEVIRQRVSIEIDRILQNMLDCRDQHPTIARRLNWVGRTQNMKKLEVYIDGMKNDRLKVFKRAHEDILSMIEREFSQNHR